MKNLAERKLAKEMLKGLLGLTVKLEDIIPLESSGKMVAHRYICDYVMFSIKYHEIIVYRGNMANLTIENHYLDGGEEPKELRII